MNPTILANKIWAIIQTNLIRGMRKEQVLAVLRELTRQVESQ